MAKKRVRADAAVATHAALPRRFAEAGNQKKNAERQHAAVVMVCWRRGNRRD